MTRFQIFSLTTSIANFILSLGVGLNIEQERESPAWVFMERLIPAEFWPVFFAGIGLLSFMGIWNHKIFRYAMYLGAAGFLSWDVGALGAYMDKLFTFGQFLILFGFCTLIAIHKIVIAEHSSEERDFIGNLEEARNEIKTVEKEINDVQRHYRDRV